MSIHPYTRFFILPSAPTVDEDETEGYEIGDVVYYDGSFYDCSDTTEGAAVWEERGAGSGSVAWGAITGTLADQTDLNTALGGKQPLDSDLTAIAALAPADDDVLQRKAGAWTSRTIAQLITDLTSGLAALFAPLAKGVTNGDTHDHVGGDGAQINHTTLSNIGTNTHAQIDTFIGTTAPATYAPIAKGVTNGDSHDHAGGDGGTIDGSDVSFVPTSDLASGWVDGAIEEVYSYAQEKMFSTGWHNQQQTVTYASADDPVYQVYVSGNVTADLWWRVGNKIKLGNNSTTFYGFIVKVGSYDSGNNRTPVDLYGGTDYDIANSTIAGVFISKVKSPDGFPLSPAKWTVQTTDSSDRTTSSPTLNIWTNPGSLSISIPIGCWEVSYKVLQRVARAAATLANMATTLSAANNSESDPDFTTFETIGGASGSLVLLTTQHCMPKVLSLTTKTSYFLNCRTTSGADSIGHRGDSGTTVIQAVCAYL